jgi:PAS domain-containing protein
VHLVTAVADRLSKLLTGLRLKLPAVETAAVRLLADRLRRRRVPLAVVVGLIGALWLGGQVSLLALIVLGGGALAAAALLSPRPNAWSGEPSAFAPDPVVEEAAAQPAGLGGPTPAEIAQQVWRTAVEAFPEPVLLVDGTGLLMRANAAVADIFPKAAAGVPVSSVTRNPELLEAIEEARRNEEERRAAEEERLERYAVAWRTKGLLIV